MTARELRRIARVWQHRLRLDHWTIRIRFDLDTEDFGVCTCSESYDEATIDLHRGHRAWTRVEANRTIVHELLHVLTRDRTAAVEGAKPLMPATAYRAFIDRHTFEDEGCIERLAHVLVELAGTV